MSDKQAITPYVGAIEKAQSRFEQNARGLVSYNVESIFAAQALAKTNYAMQVANNNPESVHLAMINVASTGLTLNPANAYAYLVPRDGAIVLDISYKGLIKIATDAGSILWARAALVREGDTFTYHGPAAMPEHVSDPFAKELGEVIGAYCVAKTKEGDILCEPMAKSEIDKIRGKSDLYAKKQSGPWVEWFDQMAKKAVIKRAAKTWPYTESIERLNNAIELANKSEGGYTLESEEEKLFKRQQTMGMAMNRWYKSVYCIQQELAKEEPDMHSVKEMWQEIPEDDQMALWLATTKGGVFSTAERKAIKENLPKSEPVEA